MHPSTMLENETITNAPRASVPPALPATTTVTVTTMLHPRSQEPGGTSDDDTAPQTGLVFCLAVGSIVAAMWILAFRLSCQRALGHIRALWRRPPPAAAAGQGADPHPTDADWAVTTSADPSSSDDARGIELTNIGPGGHRRHRQDLEED